MKRLAILFCAGLISALAACSTAQQSTATGDISKLQAIVTNGCMVVQPTLTAVAALDPVVAAAATANGLFCSTASAVTVTSLQSMLSTGIPAIEKAINDSTVLPANQKPIFIAAIGIFELTLTNALTIYGQPAAVATAPAGASAPATTSAK